MIYLTIFNPDFCKKKCMIGGIDGAGDKPRESDRASHPPWRSGAWYVHLL
jgi:hypothetical protein